MYQKKPLSSLFKAAIALAILATASPASAESFWRTGTITRILTDSSNYGGCMIRLSSVISNGCPENGWVSLDCKGDFFDASEGKRAYATAIIAQTLGSKVSVYVDNSRTASGFCVARRLDFEPAQ